MRDLIETAMFWLVIATGTSILMLVLFAAIARCIKMTLIHLDMYEDFVAYVKQRRREGRI